MSKRPQADQYVSKDIYRGTGIKRKPRKYAIGRTITEAGHPVAEKICKQKQARRATLLAIGKVAKAGGAPGPYKPTDGVTCR